MTNLIQLELREGESREQQNGVQDWGDGGGWSWETTTEPAIFQGAGSNTEWGDRVERAGERQRSGCGQVAARPGGREPVFQPLARPRRARARRLVTAGWLATPERLLEGRTENCRALPAAALDLPAGGGGGGGSALPRGSGRGPCHVL